MQTGRAEEGKALLKRSTEIKETFLKLAELHLSANEKPFDVPVRLQLGEVAEKLGRTAVALSWYQAALGLEPANEQATQAIARLKADTAQDGSHP